MQRIVTDHNPKINQDQMPHATASKSLERGIPAMLQFLPFFAFQFRSNPLLLIDGQELGFLGTVRQQKVSEYTTDYRRRPLQNQEPPPTTDAEPVQVIQDETRNRSSQNRANWVSRHQERNRPGLLALGKPVGQVQSNPGEIARLRQPQKKPHDVQLMHRVHEARQHRQHSPGNQDSGDPNPRSNLVQQQIAGNFEEEVAEKENPEDQSVLLAGNGQFLIHRQRGKPDVHAIEKGND